MITVSQAAEKILNRSRYLNEAISKDLINISSLARYIQPELEKMLLRKVSRASIIMALTRISKQIQPSYTYTRLFDKAPDITVRSPMKALYIPDTLSLQVQAYVQQHNISSHYMIASKTSSLFLAPVEVTKQVKIQFPELSENPHLLATLTITLPQSALDTPGGFYFFLKSLTWENINIVEIFTYRTLFVIVVNEKDIDRTYGVIRSLFSENRPEW